DMALNRRPARPAMVGGPARRRPAAGVEAPLPGDDLVLGQRPARRHLSADVWRQLAPDKFPHVLAEGLFLGGEIEIHQAAAARSATSAFWPAVSAVGRRVARSTKTCTK